MKYKIIFIIALLAILWAMVHFTKPGNITNTEVKINGQLITLKDGFAQTSAAPGSASKITTKYFGNDVNGDFDLSGTQDSAFLVTQETGGSGTFYYLEVVLNTKTNPTPLNAIFLGDRIAPQTTEYKDGEIIVNFADRAPGEPFSMQPSVGVSKYIKVVNGELTEVTQ